MALQIEFDATDMERGLLRVKRAVSDTTGAVDKFADRVDKAQGETDDLGNRATRAASAMRTFGSVLAAIGASAALRYIVDTSKAYEMLRSRLETLTGSQSKANAVFADLQKFAATTPFQLDQITDAYAKLVSQGINPTVAQMTSFGNTAAAMGKTLGQFVEAVLDAQTGEFERLKEFGIKASQQGDQVALTFRGVTSTIQKESSAIVGYLDSLGRTDFAGAMERQSATLGGAFSNLQDAAAQLADKVGQGGLAGELSLLARSMSETAAQGEGAANRLGQGLGLIIGLIRPAGAAISMLLEGVLGSFGRIAQKGAELAAWIAEKFAAVAEMVGHDEVAGRYRALARDAGLAADVAREFANLSFDQAAASFVTMSTSWSALVDRISASGSASQAAAGGMDALAASATKAADGAGKAGEALKAAFLAPLDTARENPLAKAVEAMVPDAERLNSLLSDLGVRTRDWGAEAAFVRRQQELGLISLDDMNRALAEIGNRTVEWGKNTEKAVEDFRKAIGENFVRGVQSSLSQFATDVLSRSGNALDNFADSMKNLLIQAASEYFSFYVMRLLGVHKLEMSLIAKENAARAAGKGTGGQGKGGGVDAGSVAGLFKSSGGFALSGSAIAGIAVFAVMAAAVAYFRHRRSERDKERYGTHADLSGYGGSISGGYAGRLDQTGAKVAEAMQMLALTIQDSARAYIDGAMNATVKIRNDKKSFQAIVDGELVGTFRTANEAVISAIKTMFLKKADLDPVIRQVLENNTATDPEALGNAVAYVQGVIDEIKGLTQIEATLQALPGKIRAMVGDLQLAGVEFSNAITMAHQWGLAQFRGAWDSISGQQRSPEEERAHRERQRELLLDQMKLERIKLQQDLAVLKARAAIVKGGAGLARQEMLVNVGSIRGRAALLEAEADITSAQFGVWGNYLDGRVQFVEAEAGLYAAEIALLEKTLADLDALIKEVETTPIRIGGRGGGLGDVIGGAGRFGGGGRLITALERLISAVDKLREFQKSLAQDEQLTPYGVQQRFGMAQAQFQNVSAAAQQGKVWAIEMLPDVARQYLELASQMYGTAGAGYGGIFEQVNQILQAISDQYPSGTDPQAWMRSGMESVNRYLAAIRGDGNRRAEQHDETNSRLRDSNRKMDDLIDAVERQGNALDRIVSTGATRLGMGGPRQDKGGRVAA